MLNLIQHPKQIRKPFNKHEIPNQVRNDVFFRKLPTNNQQPTTDNQQQLFLIQSNVFALIYELNLMLFYLSIYQSCLNIYKFVALFNRTIMNYQETIDFLFNALPMYQRQGEAAYKSDLNNSIAFDKHLNYPHRSFKTIHIAGTNGKGSTSHMLASVLQEAGYKTGLYTSPHLKDFRERIKINGQMTSEAFVVEFIEKNKTFIEQLKPSFFEMTVFMAFEYFRQEQVDVAIIEVGMGGRLDSTNLISPLLSVITNISLDHTQFLGTTLEQIAKEKAGIIKEKTPVVIGTQDKRYSNVFEQKAKELQADLSFADLKYDIPYALKNAEQKQVCNVFSKGQELYHQLELDLQGHYQIENLKTVLTALDTLKTHFDIEETHIRAGLAKTIKNTGLLGRWQVLGNNPLTVCDTGHNEAGVIEVLKQIESTPFKRLWMVWGMVNDKNIDRILELLPANANYLFTKSSVPRALDSEELLKFAQKKGLEGLCFKTVPEALQYAKNKADKDDFIFVGGSTFVVSDIL